MRRSEDMPDWVYWGLFGLNARWMAQVFLWLCVGLSAAAGLAALQNPEHAWGLAFLGAAAWYHQAIRWVDAHDAWEPEAGSESATAETETP